MPIPMASLEIRTILCAFRHHAQRKSGLTHCYIVVIPFRSVPVSASITQSDCVCSFFSPGRDGLESKKAKTEGKGSSASSMETFSMTGATQSKDGRLCPGHQQLPIALPHHVWSGSSDPAVSLTPTPFIRIHTHTHHRKRYFGPHQKTGETARHYLPPWAFLQRRPQPTNE